MKKLVGFIVLAAFSHGGLLEAVVADARPGSPSRVKGLAPPDFRLSGTWEFSRNQFASGRASYIDGDRSATDPSSVTGYDPEEIGLPDQSFTSSASYDGESKVMILDMSDNLAVAAAREPNEPVTSAQFGFQLDEDLSGSAIEPIARVTDVTQGCRVTTGYSAIGQFSGDTDADELVLIYYMVFTTLPAEPEPCFEYLVGAQNEVKSGRNRDDFWNFLVDSGTVDASKLDRLKDVQIRYRYSAQKIGS